VPFYERHVRVYHLQEESLDIDVICLTPEEFAARSSELSIIGSAARDGVEIGNIVAADAVADVRAATKTLRGKSMKTLKKAIAKETRRQAAG